MDTAIRHPATIVVDGTGYLVRGFVVRTPLLPVHALSEWSDGLEAPTSDASTLAQALQVDRRRLRERLEDWIAQPIVRESVYLAAPGLIDGIERWRRDPDSKAGRDVERSLVRYLARMTHRCTPFGLFSGITVGHVGVACRARLVPSERARRHVVIDAGLLHALAASSSRDPQVWERTRLFANTTLARVRNSYRYVEARGHEGERHYDLVATPQTPVLTRILERVTTGATVGELVDLVTECEPEVDAEAADEFLRQLVDADVLQHELEPSVTGATPTASLLRALDQTRACAASTLAEVEAQLRALDDEPLGVPTAVYEGMRARLHAAIEGPSPHTFDAQLHKPAIELELDAHTLATVVRTAELLRAMRASVDPMASFKAAFAERYGDDAPFVPLSDVLDEDDGIGFGALGRSGSPLVRDLPLRAGGAQTALPRALDPVRLRLWERAMREGSHEIVLDASEIAKLAVHRTAASRRAYAAMFGLVERPHGGPPQVVFTLAAGPSGANLLGRFAHGHGELEHLVRAHIADEEAGSEIVFAELAHVPEGRVSNVISRPVLRDYEIPCLGRSGAASDRQIPLADLVVGVVEDRVVLHSLRLGCEVAPRLTSAHNSSASAVPAYRFLAALQRQHDGTAAFWSWEGLESVAESLPRVCIGDVVVAKARWLLGGPELARLRSASDPAARFTAAQALRERFALPRYVEVGESDVRTVVDLSNTLSVDALAHEVAGGERPVTVYECYPQPQQNFVQSDAGRYAAEYCVPVVSLPSAPRSPSRGLHTPAVMREFAPGSKWSYLRIYCGHAACDELIAERLAPELRALLDDGAIDRWFFVRYADPAWHLRLRMRGDGRTLQAVAQPRVFALLERLREQRLLWKVETGTYVRELLRYGGDAAIENAEALFHADSVSCAETIAIAGSDTDMRWKLLLVACDRLLAGLGNDVAARLDIVTELARGHRRALDWRGRADVAIGERYRALRSGIDAALAGQVAPELRDALERRDHALSASLATYRGFEEAGVLAVPLRRIAGSLLHMHANRMLRSDARVHEYLVYEFLRRTYRSWAARGIDGQSSSWSGRGAGT